MLLVRIGVVALAAFLAGAVVQRTLIGNFALKLGPLEIPELKRAAAETEQALAEVGKQLKKQAEATERAMQGAADAVDAVSQLDAEMEPVRVALQQIVELSTPTQPVEESEPTVDVQLENESEEPS